MSFLALNDTPLHADTVTDTLCPSVAQGHLRYDWRDVRIDEPSHTLKLKTY